MKNLVALKDKYDFKAPLINIPESIEQKDYIVACNKLGVSTSIMTMISNSFHVCEPYPEKTVSLKHLADEVHKGEAIIRKNLQSLEKLGLVFSEFVTTDPIKNRRGTLFVLSFPSNEDITTTLIASAKKNSIDNSLEKLPNYLIDKLTALSEKTEVFVEAIITRLLIKSMRTNRKDKSHESKIDIPINGTDQKIRVIRKSEGGKSMALQDFSYYAACVTWLKEKVTILLQEDQSIPETYTIPLAQIVLLSKKACAEESTTQGYGNSALNALHRISTTTFYMYDVPEVLRDHLPIINMQLFYKLLRLESVVLVEDNSGKIIKSIRIQFPESTVVSIRKSIEQKRQYADLILIDDALLKTKNDIEILFGFWAREILIQQAPIGDFYTWNQLRESVAPSTTLSEFKRKFTSLMIGFSDDQYEPKNFKDHPKELELIKTNILASKDGSKNYIIEFGKSSIYGLIVNIGYKYTENQSIITIRKNPHAFLLGQRLNRKIQ